MDREHRTVLALVWTDASGDRQIQPLPPFKGIEPPARPILPVEQAFPGLTIGPEPPCDRSARARAARASAATAASAAST